MKCVVSGTGAFKEQPSRLPSHTTKSNATVALGLFPRYETWRGFKRSPPSGCAELDAAAFHTAERFAARTTVSDLQLGV